MRTLKSRRFEARIDPESDDIIAAAAAQCGQSKSAFIVAAARTAADRMLARNTDRGISKLQFDELVAAISDEVVRRLSAPARS